MPLGSEACSHSIRGVSGVKRPRMVRNLPEPQISQPKREMCLHRKNLGRIQSPNFTRIVAVIFGLLLVSRSFLRAQDTTPTNPTLVSLATRTVLAVPLMPCKATGRRLEYGSMAPSQSRSMRVISPMSRTPAAYKEAVETTWALLVAPEGSTKPPQFSPTSFGDYRGIHF
jgi:hypothetical protein